MAALPDFARYVRPEVPGCPEIQILDAIQKAGIEFCKQSRVYRVTVELDTEATTAFYDLTTLLPASVEPEEVLSVKRSDGIQDLDASSEHEFNELRLSEPGRPSHYYLEGNDLVLGRVPESVETLDVLVRARPSEAATTLPDVLYDRFRLQIAAGAKAMLMAMKDKPWTDLNQSASYGEMFNNAADAENVRYAKGGGSKRLRTTLHTF